MKVKVRVTKSFKKAVKPLLKKYHSLLNDLEKLEKELIKNPWLGVPIGHGGYKIRLKITSKGKGKSGGARVISLLEITLLEVSEKISEQETVVNLITIYDKSEVDSISDGELKELFKRYKNGE
jgi:mRNA-degrading endonuclease RelE of RelBE toxin-antitoxin system